MSETPPAWANWWTKPGLAAAGLVSIGLVVGFGAGWVLSPNETVSGSAEPTGSDQAGGPVERTTAPTDPGPGPGPVNTSALPQASVDSNPVPSVSVPDGTVPKAPIAEFDCPKATVEVSDAAALTTALSSAGPGTAISLADGVYAGNFTAATSGTADSPIFLCGGRNAVLQGDGPKGGYTLHFENASHWRVSGFTVRDGQKGVMVDTGIDLGLQDLLVEGTGDEAVHLRRNSTDNVVRGLTVRDTGHRKPKFGEGIYIGTAESNWSEITGGQPDHSDRNFVLDNVITGTTSEAVDVKEGTSNGVVAGNTFDGSRMNASDADSWVDIKGNGWLIAGNSGRTTPEDGYQTHVILDGWGDKNVFTGNQAELNGGSGVPYYLHRELSNQVDCDNTVGAAKTSASTELSNFPCTP